MRTERGVVSQFDCRATSRTNSFAPQPLPNSRAISSNFIAGYASALLVFALHTGLAHERRIFPIAVEKAQGDREYRDGQYQMHLPPLCHNQIETRPERATTRAVMLLPRRNGSELQREVLRSCNALFLEGGFVALVWHDDRHRHRFRRSAELNDDLDQRLRPSGIRAIADHLRVDLHRHDASPRRRFVTAMRDMMSTRTSRST